MEDSTEELKLNPELFTVSRSDLFLFMGYETQAVPMPVEAAVDQFLSDFPAHFKPRAGFRIVDGVKTERKGFSAGGTFFDAGGIISGNLKGAERVALFAVTVGPGFDTWSKTSAAEGDGLLGYIVDCAGSILAEALADRVEARVTELANRNGRSVSNRYSPGYCDWNVREQEKLFSFFPKEFCGIRLTESALMVPIKSVSGVIGMGEGVRKREYQCSVCSQERCIMARYRNRKTA